jgi:hypothetical protein
MKSIKEHDLINATHTDICTLRIVWNSYRYLFHSLLDLYLNVLFGNYFGLYGFGLFI